MLIFMNRIDDDPYGFSLILIKLKNRDCFRGLVSIPSLRFS